MNYTMYNFMTCEGFSKEIGGGCTMAWLGGALLFFIIAITRKWIGEAMGIDFNFIGGIGGGYIAYIIIISLFGSMTWALGAGVIGMALGGFCGGMFFGTGDYE